MLTDDPDMRGMNVRRGREGILVGVGAGLALVLLLVLQSFIGSGLLSTRTLTLTTTVTVSTIPEAYEQVASAHANRLLLLASRNVSAILRGYESNATVAWTGQAAGLQGNYAGIGNRSEEIGSVLDIFPGSLTNLTLSHENQTIVGAQGGYRVNSTFYWAGFSPSAGRLSGRIAAQDSYVHVGNAWLIASETWTWLAFNCEFPFCPL
jgi:hypothetical protein